MPVADNRMTAMDAAFLYLERSGQRFHVASVVTTDGPVDFESLVADLDSKLHLIPRYKQRPAQVPFGFGHPTWEPDPTFDIRNHVIRHRLRGAGDDGQLVELASRLFAQELDLRRPLWELHVIDNYGGGRSALVAKVHHCMIDGISGVQLMAVMFDPSPNPAPPPPPTDHDRLPAPPLPTPATRVWRAVQENVINRARTVQAVLEQLRRDPTAANLSRRGAYVLAEAEGGARQVTLLATGSEVVLTLAARDALQRAGTPTAVVSMPSWELFGAQDAAYRTSVLGPVGSVRVACEAALRFGWDRWLGDRGGFVGMTGFGASGPADTLYRHFGITPEAIVAEARRLLAESAATHAASASASSSRTA